MTHSVTLMRAEERFSVVTFVYMYLDTYVGASKNTKKPALRPTSYILELGHNSKSLSLKVYKVILIDLKFT